MKKLSALLTLSILLGAANLSFAGDKKNTDKPKDCCSDCCEKPCDKCKPQTDKKDAEKTPEKK